MASLSNQQFNTKSMTGLSDTFSSNIICNTFECSDEFTIDPGCVITLPANSIPDSALSTNVAFRDQFNNFSNTNTFSGTVSFTSITTPVITQSIPANDATTKIPTTSWTDTYFGKLTLASPTTTQTWFGQNRFSNSFANLAISLRNTSVTTYNGGLFIPNANGQFNANSQIGDTCLISLGTNASNTGALSLTTWSSTNCGIRITLNDVRINGTTTTLNAACSFTSTTTPVITQSIPANDVSTKIPTTQWVNTYYGELTQATGSTVQTWFGSNRFTSNSSNLPITLQNTDAPTYIGSGLFIASASAQLNPFVALGDTTLVSNGTGANNGILCLCAASPTSCGIRISGSSININGATTLTVNSLTTTFNNNATNYNVAGICSFTNTTTPVITQAISLADNSTKISTTAFVKGQNYITSSALTPYALLAGTQTFSGINTFTGISNINNTVFYNNSIDARFVAATSEATQMYQSSGGFTIASITNGKYIALNTKDATGTIMVDGVVCRDGNRAYLQSNTNTVNRIDITGNQATIGGTLVPIMTTQPLTASNNNEIASTAFVKNQNYITATALTPYALLAPTSLQTFAGTAQNTFNNQVNANAGVRFVDTFASKISQVGNALIIENISNVNSVQIRSTTAGLVQRTGLLIQNGTFCELQGGGGNTITLNAVNTPTLGIPPLAGVYSSEIATTSWVNTELVGTYARLDTAQTFTAQNTFTSALPIVIKNTVSSNSGGLLIASAGAYNGINNAGDFAVVGFGATIDTGTLNLTTWATSSCGIKIDNDTITQNAPFTCGYLQLGGPITSKTNFNIGYQWDIGGAAFTGTSWATAVGAYNIMTIAWNGTGDKTLGVWLCEVVIITNCSTAPAFSLCWNTISNTSMDISEKCTQSNLTTVFNAASHQITRLNFTLNITNFLGNYFLNSSKVGGAGLSSNTSFSQIKFTRIA